MSELRPKIPWKEIAETLGYCDRDEMLIDLYKILGIKPLADKLGVHRNSISDRLHRIGIKLRPRGGANNHGGYTWREDRKIKTKESRYD